MIEDNLQDIDLDRMIISGDFNYSYQRTKSLVSNTSDHWLAMLEQSFYNSMNVNDLADIPTFQRLSQHTSITSTIDYIFLGLGLPNAVKDTHIMRLNDKWSDHSVLSMTWMVGKSKTGPGLWRANPAYAKQKEFRKHLESRLNELVDSWEQDTSAQHQWEKIKAETKMVVRSYGQQYVSWRTTTLRFLEKKRNRFLRSKPSTALKQQSLTSLDPVIATLQQELCDVAALKAGVRWREKGEKSASYLKKIHQQRENHQFMATIQSADDDEPNSLPSSDLEVMQSRAHSFYQTLYQTDPVEDDYIDQYLSAIHDIPQVTETDQNRLVEKFEIEDLLAQAARCPKQSSPGDDGLSYPYLAAIFRFKKLQPIILEVYNDALQHQVFPPSWKDIRIRLLPKKGDLTSLRNWRPISLINCDGKIFTRLMTQRLSPIMNSIINPHQTGFINGRFIGENGMILHLLLQQAKQQNNEGIGLLLDQEKAYDRININGFFTENVLQERGLRQGDPMSPLLFNVAIEPLLLAVQQDSQYQRFQPVHEDHSISTYHPAPIKCIAYADDICAIIKDQDDFQRLWTHMNEYSAVSNARFNSHKTEAFALNGASDDAWIEVLNQHNITCYHTSRSSQAFRYLGFYMPYNIKQRNQLQLALLENLNRQVQLYSQRHLSIRGRATIMNTLILSKTWYCLRLFAPTKAFLNQVNKIAYQYIWQKKTPKAAYDQLSLPIGRGGLGMLQATTQHRILQVKWLKYMFDSAREGSCRRMLHHHMVLLSSDPTFPFTSFICPGARVGPWYPKPSVISYIHDAYDHFQFAVDHSKIPLVTLMRFPLRYMFSHYPDDYWITRHKSLSASSAFLYDNTTKGLCLKVDHEQHQLKKLHKRLYKDILERKTVHLAPYLWQYILNDTSIDTNATVDEFFLPQLTSATQWRQYSSKKYRTSSYVSQPYLAPPRLAIFWKSSMLLQARSMWYKALLQKLPTRLVIHQMGVIESPQCLLCPNTVEDQDHLLAKCSVRWAIWNQALAIYYPGLSFVSSDIIAALRLSPPPSSILDLKRFYTILSTIQWFIWKAYCNFVFDHRPLRPSTILSDVIAQVSVLLLPASNRIT